jgi:hypothetical protein
MGLILSAVVLPQIGRNQAALSYADRYAQDVHSARFVSKLPGQDSNLDKENQNSLQAGSKAVPDKRKGRGQESFSALLSAAGDASCGSVMESNESAPSATARDLARIIDLWPELPEALRKALERWPELPPGIRAGILALAEAAGK